MTRSIGENPFLSEYAQQGAPAKASNKPSENPDAPVEENPLQYPFRTPPPVGPFLDYTTIGRHSHTPSSRASTETAPASTVTKAKNEAQAIREEFKNSLAQLAQVQTRLARENSDHEMRVDAIMRDMDEKRRGLLKMQAEGQQNQGRLEASMASLNDLIKQRETAADARVAEISAVMKERDRQADERMKLMADTMQRRDMDAIFRMANLMTTMQDLTLGVEAIVSQTAAAQVQAAPRAPQKYQQVNMPSTSAAPQPTYRTVAQPAAEQIRPSKLAQPATYKRNQTKLSKIAKVAHAELRDAVTDPITNLSSLDPYARRESTSGDFHSAADEMNTRRTSYNTANSSAAFRLPAQTQTFKVFVPRPVATHSHVKGIGTAISGQRIQEQTHQVQRNKRWEC